MWIYRLEAMGASVVVLDNEHVRLEYDGESSTFRVVRRSRPILHPRDITPAPEPSSLLVVATLTKAAAFRARELGWSVASDVGPMIVAIGDDTVETGLEGAPARSSRPNAGRGRPGFGTFTVLRVLQSAGAAMSQSEVALHAAVSQPRVSQAMKTLRAAELVRRVPRGWELTDRRAAVEWWGENYPGPGGISTYWFGLDSPTQQARAVVDLLTRRKARPVVSGDVAADLVAPWRVPQSALLYATRGDDLARAGLTPTDATSATLTLVLPDDQGVWPIGPPQWMDAPHVGKVERASALQIWFDLRRGVGPDSDQAAAAWLRWMLEDGPRP